MRKTLVLFALLTLSTPGISQFYDSDAQFHVELQYGSYLPNGYAFSTQLNDTVIGGITANQLLWKGQYFYNNGPSQGGLTKTDTLYFDTLITRSSNDSVFVYREGAFHLAFNTDGNSGDLWDLGPFADYANDTTLDNNHAYLKVTAVTLNNHNGVFLKDLTTVPCDANGTELNFFQMDSADLYVSYYGVINERFGPLKGLRLMDFAISTSQVNETYRVASLCYTGSSTGFVDFDPNVTCENNFQFVGMTEMQPIEISVFPNPSNGLFHLKGAKQMNLKKYQITDLQGRVIKEMPIDPNVDEIILQIDKKGQYQLLLYTENGFIHSLQLSNL